MIAVTLTRLDGSTVHIPDASDLDIAACKAEQRDGELLTVELIDTDEEQT